VFHVMKGYRNESDAQEKSPNFMVRGVSRQHPLGTVRHKV
jgi:hypothetical protein